MALHLGKSVRQCQDEIDSREFTEWIAFYNIEPFGEERADLRAGIVASTIANVNRGKGGRAFKPAEFMPKFDKSKPKQSADEMIARLKLFARLHNQALKERGGS